MTYQEFISQFEVYNSYNEAKARGFEAHHILPRALQKDSETFDDRCIRVTSYQHFLAHYLLALEREDAVIVLYRMVNRNKVKLSDIEKVTLEDLEYWAILREQGREKASEALKGKPAWNKGIPHSDETRDRISEACKGKNKGIPKSEKMRSKLSETLKGHQISKEARDKISDSRKGKIWITDGKISKQIPKNTPIPEGWVRGMNSSTEAIKQRSEARKGKICITDGVSSRYISKDDPIPEGWRLGGKPSNKKGKPGHPQPEEAKRKLSEAHKGKTHSEEEKKKISEARKGQPGHPHSEETKKQIRETSKQTKQQCAFEYRHNNPLGLTWQEFQGYFKQKKSKTA